MWWAVDMRPPLLYKGGQDADIWKLWTEAPIDLENDGAVEAEAMVSSEPIQSPRPEAVTEELDYAYQSDSTH